MDGCELCDQKGQFIIDGCPNAFARDMFPALQVIDFFIKGTMPKAGGLCDQAAWIIDATEYYQREKTSFDGD